MKTSFAVLLAIFALLDARELPKSLSTCRRSSPEYSECLDRTVTSFIRTLGLGVDSLNIPSIEPLVIDKIKIGDNNGPVGLRQEYHNVKLDGLTHDLRIHNYKIDFDNLVLYSESINPKVSFTADYELEGQVLLFSIRGKGRSNITMTNVHATNVISCEKYVKNGETYLRVKNYEIKFNPEHVSLQFENLFDKGGALGDQLQTFISKNSGLIFEELQGPYEEAFGQVFKNIANHIFNRFTMKKLFPE